MKSIKIDNDRDFKRKLLWCVLSEEIAKSMIHDYESNLEEQDRNAFEEIKKLYEQELEKLQN